MNIKNMNLEEYCKAAEIKLSDNEVRKMQRYIDLKFSNEMNLIEFCKHENIDLTNREISTIQTYVNLKFGNIK